MPAPPPIQRREFLASLARVAGAASERGVSCGLLLVDLSNLGLLNRREGYARGDVLLTIVHEQLNSVATLPDMVFRVGGHGFAFILPQLQNPGFIALAVNRVQRLLQGALEVEDGSAQPIVRIGVGVGREGRQSDELILAEAEASLAQVKLGRALAIDELLDDSRSAPADIELEQRFAQALQDNAFELYYQPKVRMLSGEVCGAEALLRWELPGHGAVSAERVVKMAEEAGKLYELTKWVVHHALRQLRGWQERYQGALSVNIPASLVGQPDLVNMVHDALSIWGVEPARLTLEITEDAIIEDKEAGFDVLQELCNLGCRIAIDDFGTGYSSLSYFQHIPARELKIDKSFVQRMAEQPQEQSLVRIIVEIARLFDLEVVAEGVEDTVTLELLRAMGCDVIQGYYYAPALDAEAFLEWVGQGRGQTAPVTDPGDH